MGTHGRNRLRSGAGFSEPPTRCRHPSLTMVGRASRRCPPLRLAPPLPFCLFSSPLASLSCKHSPKWPTARHARSRVHRQQAVHTSQGASAAWEGGGRAAASVHGRDAQAPLTNLPLPHAPACITDEGYVQLRQAPQQNPHDLPSLWQRLLPPAEEDMRVLRVPCCEDASLCVPHPPRPARA